MVLITPEESKARRFLEKYGEYIISGSPGNRS